MTPYDVTVLVVLGAFTMGAFFMSLIDGGK